MVIPRWLALLALCVIVGCSTQEGKQGAANKTTEANKGPDEAEIKANLESLSPEDRKLAEEQKFCATETEHRLGSMGKPVKLTIKDKPVFVCCKACVKKAQADVDATLAKVEQLKEEVEVAANLAKLSAEDRKVAEAQKFCASYGESRLGAMGKPIKLMVLGEPVFICCSGCEKDVRKDEKKSLELVKKIKEKNAAPK